MHTREAPRKPSSYPTLSCPAEPKCTTLKLTLLGEQANSPCAEGTRSEWDADSPQSKDPSDALGILISIIYRKVFRFIVSASSDSLPETR